MNHRRQHCDRGRARAGHGRAQREDHLPERTGRSRTKGAAWDRQCVLGDACIPTRAPQVFEGGEATTQQACSADGGPGATSRSRLT